MKKGPGARLSLSAGSGRALAIRLELRQVPRRPRRSSLKVLGHILVALFTGILDLGVVGAIALAVFAAATLPGLPEAETIKEVRLKEPLRIYAADGSLMAEYGVEHRRPVAFDAIPPLMVKAFLAVEDARFFEHEGIDLKGIARAAVNLYQTGERSQGGSTITMQVARNFFDDMLPDEEILPTEKTFRRKLTELLLSLHIEHTLTKLEILELYLNKIFFGHRAYGLSAAAALYYDKGLDELNLAEMAMLAGLPKAPSANNPVSNPERAHERRNYILRRMRDLDYITQEEFQTASEHTDQARLYRKEMDLQAGYAAEVVRREMVERYKENAYEGGYRVTATIEPWLQRAAQDAVRKALRTYDRRHGYHGAEAKHKVADSTDEQLDLLLDAARQLPDLTAGIVVRANARKAQVYIGKGERIILGLAQVRWARPFRNQNWKGRAPRGVTDAVAVGDLIRLRQNAKGAWELSQIPYISGALVALSPADGAVRALVGGYHFDEGDEFNRAVDARRQPGSSFKPFVYAAALNKGYTPASLVRDGPVGIRGWKPKNADHRNLGAIRMRVSLTLSRNLASINLLKRVGLDEARDYIQRFGFTLEQIPRVFSIALGTAEVSPLQIAGAYALFANGGFQVKPYFINRIENGAGELVFEANASRACSHCWARYRESSADTAALGRADGPIADRVLTPGVAYEMTSMMQDVIKRGTARRALALKRKDLAGKTGTTNDERDSWFCGFQKDLVTVAWLGHDGSRPLGKGEGGGRAGLGMWVNFMREALKDKPQAILKPPAGMVKVYISGGAEWIRREYARALQGPKPIAYVGGGETSTPRRSRVIDELF